MNHFVQRHRVLATYLLACSWALVGCDNVDQVRRYAVEKPLPEDRMLAAIVPQGDRAWFFKLTGPNEKLDELSKTFFEFIGTVRIPDGEPTWQLPTGWVRTSGSSMRFATIQIDTADDPLELSVTVLPMMADEEQLLVENINRWRGQLQLSPITQGQLPDESVRMELDAESGLTATLINIVGNLSGGGMSSAPFAAGGPAAGPSAGGPSPNAARKTISYDTPEGWQPGERVSTRGGIRIERDAVFNVVDGNGQVEITVTQLPGSMQSMEGNINRWKAQAKLDPGARLPEPKQVEVGGIAGVSVELIGPQYAILGVIAMDRGTGWFVKLFGDRELALRERERFQQFVDSIQFGD